MATLVMEYTVNPFWNTLKVFCRGTWNFLESVGYARAAAEMARLGYHEEARALMLENR